VKSEKLAGLGALVAGISHELNTPIGNALVAATTVHQSTKELAAQLGSQKVSRKSFEDFVRTSLEGSELVERSVSRAADLISSFKQVAVDQASERRRQFDLAQMVHEVVSTLNHALKVAPQNLSVYIASGIVMDSYPGPLGQVLTNLINNALIHAFENTTAGEMTLRATIANAGRVLIEFTDNGCGIPDQHVNRVFDPFFTTRLGLGGGGLGLSIANNIVEGLLGGSIKVESIQGAGTTFLMDLPLVAPI
jgi:signal transduction histidine kinase